MSGTGSHEAMRGVLGVVPPSPCSAFWTRAARWRPGTCPLARMTSLLRAAAAARRVTKVVTPTPVGPITVHTEPGAIPPVSWSIQSNPVWNVAGAGEARSSSTLYPRPPATIGPSTVSYTHLRAHETD